MDSGGVDALAQICAATLEDTKLRRAEMPLEQLKAKVASQKDRPRNFGLALK